MSRIRNTARTAFYITYTHTRNSYRIRSNLICAYIYYLHTHTQHFTVQRSSFHRHTHTSHTTLSHTHEHVLYMNPLHIHTQVNSIPTAFITFQRLYANYLVSRIKFMRGKFTALRRVHTRNMYKIPFNACHMPCTCYLI